MIATVETVEGIKTRLNTIFQNRFGIDIGATQEDILNTSLLGDKFNMPARNLLYLYFDVEKEFGITIPQDDIAAGKFVTYNGICEIIHNQLNK